MERITNFWKNFKQNSDIWFFYGFLLTFTLSVRKILFFYPISGKFNEYAGSYLYLSDIFLFLTLTCWIFSIIYNKNVVLSRYISGIKKKIAVIPIFLVIWSFISIFWADNSIIALFRSIKLLEFYLLYLFIIFKLSSNVPRGTSNTLKMFHVEHFLRYFIRIIIIVALVHSFVGIVQFMVNGSLGLFFLKESYIGPDLLNIAKVILNGEKHIRAYGLFPHPNIFGGFLVFSIFLTFLYFKMFHVEHFKRHRMKIVVLIQLLALLLTFSKSAMLGLFIGLTYLIWKVIVPRGTIIKEGIKKMFYLSLRQAGVERWKWLIGLIFVMMIFLFFLKVDLGVFINKSIEDRLFYIQTMPIIPPVSSVGRSETIENSGVIVDKYLITGFGIGQYVNNLANNYHNLADWQYQPVHNVPLLILSELGIIGLFLFVWFLLELLWSKKKMFHPPMLKFRRTSVEQLQIAIFKSILVSFLFIMMLDHYFWDIQQGQIIFWITMSFLVGNSINTQYIDK